MEITDVKMTKIGLVKVHEAFKDTFLRGFHLGFSISSNHMKTRRLIHEKCVIIVTQSD